MVDVWGPGPYSVSYDNKKGTVTLRVGTAYNRLEEGFTHPGTSIVCPKGLEPNALVNGMFGSGPYTLVSATHADQAVYKLRPEYRWGPFGATAKDLADTLVIKIIVDETTAANLLVTGAMNLAKIQGQDESRLRADRSLTEKQAQGAMFTPLLMSRLPGKLTNDENLREAIMLVIDDSKWIQAAWAGDGTPSPGGIVPGKPCYDPAIKKYFPIGGLDKAKQVLTAAGYKNVGSSGNLQTPDGKPVRLRLVTNPTMNLGPEYLQTAIAALGVDVDLSNVSATFARDVTTSNFDLTISSSAFPFPLPFALPGITMGPGLAQGGRNYANTAYDDPRIYHESRLALATTGKESCKHWNTVARLLLQGHHTIGLGGQKLAMFSNGLKPTWVYDGNYYEPWSLRLK
jgi:peptide/nickel transport system substrate-binding protein